MARKILLADDSVTAQNMGRRILSDAGYEVITVNNGAAALKKISEVRPDLIVLDVYMPGYGGLEVCQRIKESPDTARIPVLLTVGKMEPFKADESKRVRADGHIIKPFEASELLTALTKLEDKIVPLADPQKPGRSGKGGAAAPKAETGDLEWKNRLRIPSPAAKPLEVEKLEDKKASQESEIPDAGFKDLGRKKKDKSEEVKASKRDALSAKEVTPEEVAALVSASDSGASKGGQFVDSAPESSVAKISSETSSTAVASSSGEAKSSYEETEVEAVTFASLFMDSTSVSSEPSGTMEKVDPVQNIQKPVLSESEFMAALASLVPAVGDGHAVEHTNGARFSENSGENSHGHATAVSGPRWVAHSLAVAEDESKLFLEHEMEKSYAAQAAALGAEGFGAATPDKNASVVRKLISVVANAEAASAEPAGYEPPSSIASDAGDSSAVEVKTGSDRQASFDSPVPAEDSSEATNAVSYEDSAFAAAASAGSVPLESAPTNAVSYLESSTIQSTDSAASAPQLRDIQADRERETELAAAWQNWKQIRENIVGTKAEPQSGTGPILQTSDSAAAISSEPMVASGFKDLRREPKAVLPEVEQAAEKPETDDAAISSIVDNMLADLKPKLMEEIARKMAKETK
ncbi:MAG: response regulator receiver protein [Acidobacteriaceae bacterium]|nr:response regulator receiver protein [Acidobacteriaceae bacterium]